MGGFGSGRPFRGGKRSVETLPEARLTFAHTMRVNKRTYVRIETDDLGVLVHGAFEYPVRIDRHYLHYGGYRRWLICPLCDSRRQSLYIDGQTVGCRYCLNLRCETHHANAQQRLSLRVNRIRKRLGWPVGYASGFGCKPMGMHWKTYYKLTEELAQVSDALTISLGKWVKKADARLERMGR